jgi:hypothetical protein
MAQCVQLLGLGCGGENKSFTHCLTRNNSKFRATLPLLLTRPHRRISKPVEHTTLDLFRMVDLPYDLPSMIVFHSIKWVNPHFLRVSIHIKSGQVFLPAHLAYSTDILFARHGDDEKEALWWQCAWDSLDFLPLF